MTSWWRLKKQLQESNAAHTRRAVAREELFLSVLPRAAAGSQICEFAAGIGSVPLLERVRAQAPPFEWSNETSVAAAGGGHLGVLKWLRNQDPPCSWNAEACEAAVSSGHLDVLRWMRSQPLPCPWDAMSSRLATVAAFEGHLDALQYLHQEGCAWDESTTAAAAAGDHLHVLQWCRAATPPCPWDTGVAYAAVESGSLQVVQWLLPELLRQGVGCLIPGSLLSRAANAGHLAMLQWMAANAPAGQPLWTASDDAVDACTKAAAHGHLDVLRCLRGELKCPWNEEACSAAAQNGHLNVLQWLHAGGCPWDDNTSWHAADRGDLEMFKWACSRGCPCTTTTSQLIAEQGNFEMLRWAHENGCPWDATTCTTLAANGHLDMLKWAHTNGCPFAKKHETCSAAALNGELEILQWLHEQDCPWDASTTAAALKPANLKIYSWLKNNGCPAAAATAAAAARHGLIDILMELHVLQGKKNSGVKRKCISLLAMNAAAAGGQLATVQWLRSLTPPCPWSVMTCVNAARSGNYELLRWMR
ncbi:hypothetical protein JKP88DRAFT_178423 [Tribonema minus]|uniref:Ankyrin repeat domain-containing protein n=1 Tax=Tribonema minus TaxID=303371 RepID=A0A835Z6S9_9STRA|nr:hypothetical protein JKP88DRAFT_178423 [Tribonema minus]